MTITGQGNREGQWEEGRARKVLGCKNCGCILCLLPVRSSSSRTVGQCSTKVEVSNAWKSRRRHSQPAPTAAATAHTHTHTQIYTSKDEDEGERKDEADCAMQVQVNFAFPLPSHISFWRSFLSLSVSPYWMLHVAWCMVHVGALLSILALLAFASQVQG